MTFSENGHGTDIPAEKSLLELESELSVINQERCNHCNYLEKQWPNIPPEAIHYLANNCPKPELMSPALAELRCVLTVDPETLSDPDLIPIIVDDCVSVARGHIADDKETSVEVTAKSLDATALVIAEINDATANLKGRAKLSAAQEYLSDPDIPESVRTELTARLDQIETTLASMSSIFTDVDSQSEFERIISTASFDFGASDMAGTFKPILSQIEMNDKFTSEQKFKLWEIVTGSDA